MNEPAYATLADISRLKAQALAGDLAAEDALFRVASQAEDRRVCHAALLALTWILEANQQTSRGKGDTDGNT